MLPVDRTGATTRFDSQTVSVFGTLTLTNGTLNNTGPWYARGDFVHGAGWDGGGYVILFGPASRTVTLSAAPLPGQFNVSTSSVTVNGPESGTATGESITLSTSGQMHMGAANLTLTGTLSISSSGIFSIGSGDLEVNTISIIGGSFTGGSVLSRVGACEI